MKNLSKYIIGSALVVICAAFLLGWPIVPFLCIFGLGFGLYLIHPIAPKIAKIIFTIVVLILAFKWAGPSFVGYFPTFADSLPMGSTYQQMRASKIIRPPLSDVKVTLVNELRKKETALTKIIPNLMKEKKYNEIKMETQELVELQKLLPQTNPPPPPVQMPGQTLTLSPGVNTIPAGIHILAVKKATTNWIKIPGKAYWDLSPINKGDYKLITFDGQIITFKKDGNKYADFPNGISIFKIQTDDELDFVLTVKPISIT